MAKHVWVFAIRSNSCKRAINIERLEQRRTVHCEVITIPLDLPLRIRILKTHIDRALQTLNKVILSAHPLFWKHPIIRLYNLLIIAELETRTNKLMYTGK